MEQMQDIQEQIRQYKDMGMEANAILAAVQAAYGDSATPLGLNQWKSTDKPTMADFNRDNEIIDREIRALQADTANRVHKNGSTIMTGALQAPNAILHHGNNESYPYTHVRFRKDGKDSALIISDYRGRLLLRLMNPSNESEYKQLELTWDGGIFWNGRKVLTE